MQDAHDNMATVSGLGTGPNPNVQAVVIEPRRGWLRVDFGEIWQARQLFYFLTWRDIKARYKQTVLGAVWAVIPPIMNMIIFSFIFGRVAGIDSEGYPYPIFVYAGLLPWTFFSKAVTLASNSLVSQKNIVTKVYFPRLILPVASLGAALIDFFMALAVYALILLGYCWFGGYLTDHDLPGISILLLPVLVALMIVTALGVGTFLGSFIVVYRDFRMVVGYIVHVWMYLSPVIYPSSVIPEEFRFLFPLNPMVGIISAFRSILLHHPVEWQSLGTSAAISIVLFLIGIHMFRRTERRFADIA